MTLTLQYFRGCPSWQVARSRLLKAMRETGIADSDLVLQAVESPEDAQRLGFRGSPSIRLDGEDLLGAGTAVGLACRLYSTPEGTDGAPTVEQLVSALVAAVSARADVTA